MQSGGVQLYETLSPLEYKIILFAIPALPDHPKQCFCCHVERPGKVSSATSPQPSDRTLKPHVRQGRWSVPSIWTKTAVGQSSNPSNSSTARQRYTPPSSSSTMTPVASPQRTSGSSTSPSAMNSSSSSPQISGQPTAVAATALPNPSLRVLFGVQGSRWSLEVEQISITAAMNDPAFFRELKTRYSKHRGWMKKLVSAFRFRFCRFVKVPLYPAQSLRAIIRLTLAARKVRCRARAIPRRRPPRLFEFRRRLRVRPETRHHSHDLSQDICSLPPGLRHELQMAMDQPMA